MGVLACLQLNVLSGSVFGFRSDTPVARAVFLNSRLSIIH